MMLQLEAAIGGLSTPRSSKSEWLDVRADNASKVSKVLKLYSVKSKQRERPAC